MMILIRVEYANIRLIKSDKALKLVDVLSTWSNTKSVSMWYRTHVRKLVGSCSPVKLYPIVCAILHIKDWAVEQPRTSQKNVYFWNSCSWSDTRRTAVADFPIPSIPNRMAIFVFSPGVSRYARSPIPFSLSPK
eukprot:01395_1